MSASAVKSVFLVGAKRTPFGSFGGSLKTLSSTELGVVATQAALQQANLDPKFIQDCYFGNVIPSSQDAAYLARHVALKVGAPVETPALTINRLCGSGFETVLLGAQSIQLGRSQVVICGGAENMSQAPLQVNGADARFGVSLGGGLKLGDALWDGLTDAHANLPMGMTAENLGKKYGITRTECDEFAILSQRRWKEAHDAGIFEAELAPVTITHKKKTIVVDKDEHPRPESTLDKISQLPPVFQKEHGLVTAANASGICDGAGCILLASEQAVQQHNLTPLCRLVSYATVGCDPTIMGIGPVPALQMCLQAAGLASIGEVDRVEINEAFAAQFLACARALDLDLSVTNVHGGAIALGHPLAASGSRITAHLAHEFQRDPSILRSVGAACIGGGQGIALLLERV